MNKGDYILLLGMILLLLSGGIFIFNYFTTEINECVSNPFVYGANNLEKQLPPEVKVYGSIGFINNRKYNLSPLVFNSTNIFTLD